MKVTDFAPRTAPFDHLAANRFAGCSGLVMMEAGVDAGAHAESMMRHISGIARLVLVDPWEGHNIFQMGICKGRLDAVGGYGRYEQHALRFQGYAQKVEAAPVYHGIYCDLPQDAQTAKDALALLWPLVRPGGLFGYRNYSPSHPDMKSILDGFVKSNNLEAMDSMAELIIFK